MCAWDWHDLVCVPWPCVCCGSHICVVFPPTPYLHAEGVALNGIQMHRMADSIALKHCSGMMWTSRGMSAVHVENNGLSDSIRFDSIRFHSIRFDSIPFELNGEVALSGGERGPRYRGVETPKNWGMGGGLVAQLTGTNNHYQTILGAQNGRTFITALFYGDSRNAIRGDCRAVLPNSFLLSTALKDSP